MIKLKTLQEIKTMKEGGNILAKIFKKLEKAVRPGIAASSIEKLANELVLFYKVKPAFLGYGKFPASTCVSINDEVVHCIPTNRTILTGDVVSLDFGIIYKGFYLDSATTILARKDNKKSYPEKEKLISVTRKALGTGISQAKAGNYVGDIGYAIESFVKKEGFSVIRDLVGHGIGRELHEGPSIPNFGKRGTGEKLKIGMVVAIEPMLSTGDWKVELADDGFTYKTKDGSPSAHFEHTVAITKNGPSILTKAT